MCCIPGFTRGGGVAAATGASSVAAGGDTVCWRLAFAGGAASAGGVNAGVASAGGVDAGVASGGGVDARVASGGGDGVVSTGVVGDGSTGAAVGGDCSVRGVGVESSGAEYAGAPPAVDDGTPSEDGGGLLVDDDGGLSLDGRVSLVDSPPAQATQSRPKNFTAKNLRSRRLNALYCGVLNGH